LTIHYQSRGSKTVTSGRRALDWAKNPSAYDVKGAEDGYQEQGIQVLGKSGGTGNYNSMVCTVPDERISVAVIETGPGGRSVQIALSIPDAILVEKGLANVSLDREANRFLVSSVLAAWRWE